MLSLEVVNLADVFPIEDEFGNQYTSRDYSLKANQDYVAELAASMAAKGEPDEPIQLVRDGGVYRIKTGNSRVMAMRMLGTKRCHAVIDDEDTPKSVLEAVVRTDTKKKYEGVELSRYVQQLALFGDDDYVSAVTGIGRERVGRIRRGAKAVADAAEDMTLERLELIDEFADDADAVRELAGCGEAEAKSVARGLREKRAVRERAAAFGASLALNGVEAFQDRGDMGSFAYFVTVPDPASVPAYLPESWGPGQVRALVGRDTARCELYVDPSLARGDAKAAERRRLADAYAEELDRMDASRGEWFFGLLADGRDMELPHVMKQVLFNFETDERVKGAVAAMREASGDAYALAKSQRLSLYDLALGYLRMDMRGRDLAHIAAGSEAQPYARGRINSYLDLVAEFRSDGWDPGDGTALLERLARLADGERLGEGE